MTTPTTPMKNDEKALLSLKKKMLNLSQFIVKLTNFYQGISPSLDGELKTLRANLSNPETFGAAEANIRMLVSLMMDDSVVVRNQNHQSADLLKNSIRNLQGQQNLPEATQKAIDELPTVLRMPPSSFLDSLANFEQILTLYQEIIEQYFHPASHTKPAVAPKNVKTDGDAGDEYQYLIDELSTLLGGLKSSNSKDAELSKIRVKLRGTVAPETLLYCCQKVITVLSKDISVERSHNEKFVVVLQNSLSDVNEKVAHSIEGVEQQFSKKEQNSDFLIDQITDIENVVDSSTYLQQLKNQANDYLSKISANLDDRKQSDKEEQLQLIALLNDMQSQLSSLENDAAEYKKRLAEQKHRSNRDPLTKLANRTAYEQRVEIEYLRWRRSKLPLSLAVLDIDHFKRINDTYGHAAGDKTLQVIAQAMDKIVRSTDFLSRWGGEEFVILFPDTDTAGLSVVLEKIRRKIQAIPFKFKDEKVTITISIGATYFNNNDSPGTVFERADENLYKAKNTGRNRCVLE
jgi:diguanylate cyclase (GGDEF)-like protein